MHFKRRNTLFLSLLLITSVFGLIVEKETSSIALGLSEIIEGLQPSCLSIFITDNFQNQFTNDFILLVHKLHIKTCVFFEKSNFLKFIENNILGSIESFSLIFSEPTQLTEEIHNKNLAHRLCLFMFYWGAQFPPHSKSVRFEEPMRAVVITNPRPKALRVYYNQAIPTGKSNLHLVNWYDGNSMGLYKTPLLPDAGEVYSNFQGRIFYVPVIHSPPWFFVDHENDTMNITYDENYNGEYFNSISVKSGRDHHLLCLLSEKMNFNFQYIDPEERTQGTYDENDNFTGGIGMLQKKKAHFLLGDVGLSWERRKAVEFSFFTLADSGAFATHAPKRLNEALALLRPFKINVWPYIVLTVILSGPAMYAVIVIPHYFHPRNPGFTLYPEYIMEITRIRRQKPILLQRGDRYRRLKPLFKKCIWFTVHVFLKQSCAEPYYDFRSRFLTIIYWIAATNVLAAIYSAQLTSQFARPARESPIDRLEKLEYAIKYQEYKLYVEKDSSSLAILENSTEIFRRLYELMKSQGENGYLVDSVEQGIKLISDGSKKVILAGRETIYYNIKRYGVKSFQLSYKLYTRYSAVAVQIGCPFLNSLNDVLMRLFESGILDKITDSEYDKMSKFTNDSDGESNENIGKDEDEQKQIGKVSDNIIEPINLRMIQGAFIVLLSGYLVATFVFCIELMRIKL